MKVCRFVLPHFSSSIELFRNCFGLLQYEMLIFLENQLHLNLRFIQQEFLRILQNWSQQLYVKLFLHRKCFNSILGTLFEYILTISLDYFKEQLHGPLYHLMISILAQYLKEFISLFDFTSFMNYLNNLNLQLKDKILNLVSL